MARGYQIQAGAPTAELDNFVKMKALKPFHNGHMKTKDGSGSVQPGDKFETNIVHARELEQNGLAESPDGKLAPAPEPEADASAKAITSGSAKKA